MKSMVTQVEEVLNEVGLCDFNDVVYKTTKLNEKRKNRNLTVIDKNTDRSSVFSKGLRGYGTTTRNKDGRVISSPVNPNYWNEPEDPVTRYEKGLKKRAKERQRNTVTSPTRAPGETDDRQRQKEKLRKLAKKNNPNKPLRFDGSNWISDSHTKEFNEETIYLLAEVSWRTVGLGVSLGNIHRHHKTRDNEAKKLKSLGSSLQASKTDEDRWKILGQIFSIIGNITIPQAKNDWWQGAATASGSVGIDKKIDRVMNLIKDLQRKLKQPKRR